jgi:hypothetical protein
MLTAVLRFRWIRSDSFVRTHYCLLYCRLLYHLYFIIVPNSTYTTYTDCFVFNELYIYMYMWIVQARYKCTWILNASVLRLLKSGVVRSIVAPEDCCQKVTSIYVCTVPEIHYYQKKYGMLNASLSLCDTQSQNPMASTCTIVVAAKKTAKNV